MPNTSASGGYLTPTSSTTDGDALDDQIQAIVVGVSGLVGSLVRPRWQPTPPARPSRVTTWCAIGVTQTEPDANPVVEHDSSGEGQDILTRHEVLTLLASFYGPDSKRVANVMRDGLEIAQNREWMLLNNMGVLGIGEVNTVPELVGQEWIDRQDLTIRIRRRITRTYAVLHIGSAGGIIESEESLTPWNVES